MKKPYYWLASLTAALLLGMLAPSLQAQITWNAEPSFSTARGQHATASDGSKIAIFGGYSGGGAFNSVEIFDIATGTWSAGPNMPAFTRGHSAAYCSATDRIYVMGGIGNVFQSFDLNTNTFAPIASPPTSDTWENAVAVGCADKVFYLGGEFNYNANYSYDPNTNTWSVMAPIPTGVIQHGAVEYNNKIYLFGGVLSNQSTVTDLVQIYDIATDTWTTGTPMPETRNQFGTALDLSNGQVYIIGGKQGYANNAAPFFDNTWVYDIATDSWTVETSLPYLTGENDAVAAGGNLYVTGGTNGTFLSNFYSTALPATGSCEYDAYGIDNLNGDIFVGIDLLTGNTTPIGPISGAGPNFKAGGEIIDGVYYFFEGPNLYSADLATGAATLEFSIPGTSFTSLELDPTTDILYGISSICGSGSSLYTIDLNTNSATLVGTTNTASCVIWLAIDESGNAWVTDLVTDDIFPYSLATGQVAGAGVQIVDQFSNPIDLNFGQDAEFDCPLGGNTLYGYLLNATTFTLQYGTFNPTTGVFSLIQDLGMNQIGSFAVCADMMMDEEPFTASGQGFAPDCPETEPLYSANGSFQVTISDSPDCGNTTYNITVSAVPNSSPQGNTPAVPSPPAFVGVSAGTYTFNGAGVGTYNVQVEETGACNSPINPVTFTVEVPQGTDDEAPEFDPCPGVVTITLDPGACGAFYNYIVDAFDNCDDDVDVMQTDNSGFTSGDFFPIGSYDLEYTATDNFGNTSTCEISLNVLEFPNPTPSLSCNDLVQISLDQNGEAIVGADDILEGGPYGCYDDYIVDVLNSFGFSIGNEVDCDNIGTTWGVMVTDPETGNKCWGEIVVEDKLAPVINCVDYTISCTEDYMAIPFPDADDNCDLFPDVQIVDNYVVDNDACDDDIAVVQRTFIAIDEYGNESALCTETITIERPEDVDFPNDIMWECDQYDVYPNITDPADLHPSVAALQVGTELIDATNVSNANVLQNTGSGIPLDLDGQFCGYQYTHADAVLDDCGTSFKIVRTWTVLDWCNSTVVTSNQAGEDNVQVIKVVDITGPSVSIAPFEVSANITGQHPMPCTSQDFLPPATITDNCNDWTVRIYTPIGEANYLNGVDGTNGGFIPAPGLELGVHTILYQAEDECGNITELFVDVEVVDDIAPTAICDEITDVNLSSDGLAVVNASVFDDGSYDNCCLEEFLVRRMDGDCEGNFDEFDPTVEFCCSDVATGEPVMVVFRAVDCFGNANDCMVEVNVNDKLAPILTSCPPNATISCDDYLDNYAAGVEQEDYSVLDGFGSPTWYDNCDLEIDTNVTVNIDACSEGTITRSWTANDAAGNGPVTCTQTITVFHVSDWVVEFPADITVECVDGSLPDFGEPEVFFDECELIGTSFEDVYFYIVPDACYKIERYWTVINWCVYDEYGTDVWEEVADQDIIGFQDWNNDGEDDDRTFRDGWNESGLPGTPDGYIDFKQIIKVIDEDDPEFTIPAIDGCIVETDCDTDILLPYPDITDECSPEFDVDISGDLGNYDNITLDGITVADVGVGTYTITYAVTDNCGNTAYQTFDLEVEDCKLPTPYCQDLVIEIMQTGMVEVWAEDFDAGSFDNCGPVEISFSQDTDDTSLTFTCNTLGNQTVEIWVTDIYGNQDFCLTNIIVQDNMNVCQAAPVVAAGGSITNEAEEAVENVNVDLSGTNSASLMTDVNGGYLFTNIPSGGDYTITPALDEDHDNGVSTWDVVLIMRHILNVDPLDSPYQLIAADANKSNSISSLDMVEIRKVILQLQTEFTDNTSWRFVDKDFVFPDPTDPFTSGFPEVISYNNLSQDELFADFYAVKIGDVNGSASTHANSNASNRNFVGAFVLNTKDQAVKAGDRVAVSLSAADLDVLGYQFTLNFDKNALELLNVVEGEATEENIGLSLLEEGAITTSWNAEGGLPTGDLFTLEFRAMADAQLSELLSVSSRFTAAEAYNLNGELLDVNLAFNGSVATPGFALYQNVPNPFNGETMIGFDLPEASTAVLTVFDMSGKVVTVMEGAFEKGYNQIALQNLNATGVLYYTLETANNTATRKMVRMD
jgi:hypothetical protein